MLYNHKYVITYLSSPPYICYVTLPGGSCFATFENCSTKVQEFFLWMNVVGNDEEDDDDNEDVDDDE